MRLIDADAFSEEMKRRQDACEKWMHAAEMLNDEDMIARANGAWSVFIETKLTLEKQPTVDAVERKRGRWIRKSNTICYWYECSECGEKPLKTVYGDIARSTFCPWCGADMRDER